MHISGPCPRKFLKILRRCAAPQISIQISRKVYLTQVIQEEGDLALVGPVTYGESQYQSIFLTSRQP